MPDPFLSALFVTIFHVIRVEEQKQIMGFQSAIPLFGKALASQTAESRVATPLGLASEATLHGSDRFGLALVLHSPAQPDDGGSEAALHEKTACSRYFGEQAGKVNATRL
jgi:hypothetical protein